jgi:membrane-bound inhibitor of C-type lysozyme
MIKRLFGVLAVLGLVSGVSAGAPAQSSMSSMPSMKVQPKVTVYYMCHGLKVKAVYDNVKDRVSFVWGAKDQHLPHVKSADGARYANASLQWWEKGDDVTLSSMPEGNVLATCTLKK